MFFKAHLFTNIAFVLDCWLNCLHNNNFWGLSSVGLERMLDRHEVAGSNPVDPTKGLLEMFGRPYSYRKTGDKSRSESHSIFTNSNKTPAVTGDCLQVSRRVLFLRSPGDADCQVASKSPQPCSRLPRWYRSLFRLLSF